MNCRHCGSALDLTLVDLGTAPPSNAYLTSAQLQVPEARLPLRVRICESCWLAQTEDFAAAEELFSAQYAYFSSYSSTWLDHARSYVEAMVARFGLAADHLVVEIAANDGYLLQFVKARGIPCLGVEPTASTAAAAKARGIEIIEEFFGARLAHDLAQRGMQADLMVANNVLAHVPDVNDFLSGFRMLLKPSGVATFEFPHLLRLIDDNQFDTIYHEHYSYLSLTAAQRILKGSGLDVIDVEELPTHGGSLRVFVQRADTGRRDSTARVGQMLDDEARAGLQSRAYYSEFQRKVERVREEFRAFLAQVEASGQKIGAYGAAAKGNTLLNYAGVGSDIIRYVVDKNVVKQGKFLPGSHIPIVDEEVLRSDRPDWILILPWNLKEEIMKQLSYVGEWGGKFVTAIPGLHTDVRYEQ